MYTDRISGLTHILYRHLSIFIKSYHFSQSITPVHRSLVDCFAIHLNRFLALSHRTVLRLELKILTIQKIIYMQEQLDINRFPTRHDSSHLRTYSNVNV